MVIDTSRGLFSRKSPFNKLWKFKPSTKSDRRALTTKEVQNQSKLESQTVKSYNKKLIWCKNLTTVRNNSHRIKTTSVTRKIQSNLSEAATKHQSPQSSQSAKANYSLQLLLRPQTKKRLSSSSTLRILQATRYLNRRGCLKTQTKFPTICHLRICKHTIRARMSSSKCSSKTRLWFHMSRREKKTKDGQIISMSLRRLPMIIVSNGWRRSRQHLHPSSKSLSIKSKNNWRQR